MVDCLKAQMLQQNAATSKSRQGQELPEKFRAAQKLKNASSHSFGFLPNLSDAHDPQNNSLNQLRSLGSIQHVLPSLSSTLLAHAINHTNHLYPLWCPFAPGWREAITVKCLFKEHNQDWNPHSGESTNRSWVRCTKPLGNDTHSNKFVLVLKKEKLHISMKSTEEPSRNKPFST